MFAQATKTTIKTALNGGTMTAGLTPAVKSKTVKKTT
jgi:hypothetical protein